MDFVISITILKNTTDTVIIAAGTKHLLLITSTLLVLRFFNPPTIEIQIMKNANNAVQLAVKSTNEYSF
jgi:hypothetical protein